MDYVIFLATITGGNANAVVALQMFLWAVFSGILYIGLKRKFRSILGGYFIAGFLGLGLPMKLMLPATSWVGCFFLSSIWPLWMAQTALGINVTDYIPEWLGMLMFS